MNLLDIYASIPKCYEQQIEICKEAIEWAVEESRVFLRQALQTRLVNLYVSSLKKQCALLTPGFLAILVI